MTTPIHDIPALAALIDARLHDSASPARTAIIAGVIVEHPTTAMEMGRAMGIEEAARVCDERSAELARESTEKGSELILRDSLLAAGLATAIRALSPAVDVQGLTEQIARALKETVKLKWITNDSGIGEPELEKVIITEENITLCARAVLSALGLERVKE